MIEFKHIDGDNGRKIILYALSTCGWCRKAKKILSKLGMAYDYVDADLGDEKTSKEVTKWAKKEIYPTLVIDNKIGFLATDLDKVKKALGK